MGIVEVINKKRAHQEAVRLVGQLVDKTYGQAEEGVSYREYYKKQLRSQGHTATVYELCDCSKE